MFILYGATGDLAKKRIIPALKELNFENVLLLGRRFKTKAVLSKYIGIELGSNFRYSYHEVGTTTINTVCNKIEKVAFKYSSVSVYVALNNANESLMTGVYNDLKCMLLRGLKVERIFLEKTVGNSLESHRRIVEKFNKILNKPNNKDSCVTLIDHYTFKYDFKKMYCDLTNSGKQFKLEQIDIDISVPDPYTDRAAVLTSSKGVMLDMVQSHVFVIIARLYELFNGSDLDRETVKIDAEILDCEKISVPDKDNADVFKSVSARLFIRNSINALNLNDVACNVNVSNDINKASYNKVIVNGEHILKIKEKCPYIAIFNLIKTGSPVKCGVFEKPWKVIDKLLSLQY